MEQLPEGVLATAASQSPSSVSVQGRTEVPVAAASEISGHSPMSGGRRLPLCRYGAKCRQTQDPEHCRRYDHTARLCKFGAECRRQGRGCRYQHPGGESQQKAFLQAANQPPVPAELGEGEGGPEPEKPVPFLLFLSCVAALGLILLPLAGECDASRHEQLWWLGCSLLLPFPLLLLLQQVNRPWLLRRFLSGEYSERATFRNLGCLWYPQRLQLLRYTAGDLVGNNIEQYATWETNDIQQQLEDVSGGSREGGQVSQIPGSPGSFRLNFPGELPTCPAFLESDCTLSGLGVEARFDGSHIVSQEGAWSKAGYWRLDYVTKVLLLLLLLGAECLFVAVEMPPGVSAVRVGQRMPLEVVLVLDGSSSITEDLWQAGQRANEALLQELQKTYLSRPEDLSIGIVQFSTKAQVEQPVTKDLEAVRAKLKSLPQLMGTTYYNEALQKCREALEAGSPQRRSFQMCVLITDGIDMSKKSTPALQSLLSPDTAIFGIYAGSYQPGIDKLQSLVACGPAQRAGQECDFFASATDYKALASKAHDIAVQVSKGVDLATCAMMSALIGLPTILAMCLPYILWYTSCTSLTLWKRHARQSKHSNNNFAVSNNNFAYRKVTTEGRE